MKMYCNLDFFLWFIHFKIFSKRYYFTSSGFYEIFPPHLPWCFLSLVMGKMCYRSLILGLEFHSHLYNARCEAVSLYIHHYLLHKNLFWLEMRIVLLNWYKNKCVEVLHCVPLAKQSYEDYDSPPPKKKHRFLARLIVLGIKSFLWSRPWIYWLTP